MLRQVAIRNAFGRHSTEAQARAANEATGVRSSAPVTRMRDPAVETHQLVMQKPVPDASETFMHPTTNSMSRVASAGKDRTT